jgi:hypothetical protein
MREMQLKLLHETIDRSRQVARDRLRLRSTRASESRRSTDDRTEGARLPRVLGADLKLTGCGADDWRRRQSVHSDQVPTFTT